MAGTRPSRPLQLGLAIFLAYGLRTWDPSDISLVPVAGLVISVLLILAGLPDAVPDRWRSRYRWALFAVYEAGVLVMGLRPKGRFRLPEPGSGELLALGSGGTYDVLMNVIGFIPLGFLLAVALTTPHPTRQTPPQAGTEPSTDPSTKRPRTRAAGPLAALAVCGLTSLGIELAQYLIANRSSSLVDVATNVAGAAIGVAYAAVHAHLWERYPSREQ